MLTDATRQNPLAPGNVYRYQLQDVETGEEWEGWLERDRESTHVILLKVGDDDWPVHRVKDHVTGEEFYASSDELTQTTRVGKEAA